MFSKIHKFKNFVGPKVWRYLIISVGIGVILFVVESSFIFVIQGFLFSIGLLNRSQVFLPDWYPTSLLASVIVLVTFGAARAVVFMLKSHFTLQSQITFTCDQRGSLLDYGLKNAGVISSKNLIAAFTEITTQSGNVIFLISNLIITMIAGILLFVLGLKLAMIEMLTGVILLFCFLWPLKLLTRKISSYGKELIYEWERLSSTLIKGLKNYFFLSVYDQIDTEVKIGHLSIERYHNNYSKFSIVSGIISAIPLLIGTSILSFITYISVNFLHTDGMKLVSFFYLFIRLAQTSSEIHSTVSNLKLSLAGFKILYDWKLRYKNSDLKLNRPIREISGQDIYLDVKDVSFRYGNNPFLFNNLNLNLKTKDVLLIKGESGSGKSSFLSLLLDINRPSEGEILLNKVSMNDYKINLNKILGYVGPEPFLLQGTIRENLEYGLQKAGLTDDEIWPVIDKMKLRELIESLPGKLNENLNEISHLSTGQKQRLSFARALLRKPKLLILDEATANLDNKTELEIIENIKDYFDSCLVIIVSHKDSFDSIATHKVNLKT